MWRETKRVHISNTQEQAPIIFKELAIHTHTHTYTNLSAMIVILIMSENTVTNRTIIKTITNVTLSPIFFGQGVLSWGLLYV